MAEETWRILISDAAGDGGGDGGGGGAQISDAELPPAQKHFFENAAANFSLWKPFITVGGMLYAMFKSSSIANAALKGTWDILKAMMDVVLLPLQPIITKIFEALAPLVPKIGELAKAFLNPIVDWILPKLEGLLDWALDVDWTELTAKWKEHGEKVVGHLESIWSWVADKAWPKLTEWWSAIKGIWEGDDSFLTKLSNSWSVIWKDIKPMAETAWEAISGYWKSDVLPFLEDFWNEDVFPVIEDFWNTKVFPIISDFWANVSRIAAIVWDVIVLKAQDVWEDIAWRFNAYILTPVAKSWEVITTAIGETWKSITNYVKDGWVYITETLIPNMIQKLGPGLLMLFGNSLGLVSGAVWAGIEKIFGKGWEEKRPPPPVFRDPTGMGTIGRNMDKIWGTGGYQEHYWPGSLQTRTLPTYMDEVREEDKQRKEERADRNININFENYGPIIGADDSAVAAFWQEVEDRILGILNTELMTTRTPH
jgi:hypothetical protein